MTPEEFRAAFIKSRGLNLDSTPIVPTPVQTMPINPTEPYRMPSADAVNAWRTGAKRDIAAGNTANPIGLPPTVKPGPFPTDAAPAPAVPYAAPVVQAGGPQGITLNSTPAAPGWAGTVGVPPPTPEAAAAYQKGNNDAKLMAGLEDIAKGIKNKQAAPTDLNTITPISASGGNVGGAAGGQASQLMAAMLQNARKNYGISLTG